MEKDRWYEEEELYQLAQELNLNHFTIPNLLNYGVKHDFIIPESQNTTTTESIFNDDDEGSGSDEGSLKKRWLQKWQDNYEKKAQKEKKIANLEKEIANLTEKLEQERQEFKKLHQEAEILQDLLKS
uniref:Uncharacterized protein n=2 Tax=Gloeothece TaxID=28070 RepID=E0U9I0_GLOV7|nr:hypothetical protein Cyan7822_0636 [Gloeothece verrucosa PCC 7822]